MASTLLLMSYEGKDRLTRKVVLQIAHRPEIGQLIIGQGTVLSILLHAVRLAITFFNLLISMGFCMFCNIIILPMHSRIFVTVLYCILYVMYMCIELYFCNIQPSFCPLHSLYSLWSMDVNWHWCFSSCHVVHLLNK